MWLRARLPAAGSAIKCRPAYSDCAKGRIGNLGCKVARSAKRSRSCLLAPRKASKSKARNQIQIACSVGPRIAESRRRVEGVSVTTYSTRKLVLVDLGQRDVVERHPFYVGIVPERGMAATPVEPLPARSQLAPASAATTHSFLPAAVQAGVCQGGLARPPWQRRVGPFPPRILGPFASLVGPSHPFLRVLHGSVGTDPYRKRIGIQE